MRFFLMQAGGAVAARPDPERELARLKACRSGSEFRAYLASLRVPARTGERQEFTVAASGPDWDDHRARMLRAAATVLQAER